MNNLKKIIAIATIASSLMMTAGPALAVTADELQAQIDTLMAQLATLQTQLAELTGEEAVTIEGCTITSFDRNLKQAMTGDDVNCLQIVLNSDSDTQLAESGVGSPGEETSYFGPLTKAAVIKFQELYADEVLYPWPELEGKGTGFVGKLTRAKLNELLTGPVVPTGCECTDWEDVACGGGDCLATEMEQTRTCAPEEGAAEDVCEDVATTQCVADTSCVAGEGLSVALAADTPVMAALPRTATNVPYLKVNFTADSNADVVIDGLTLKRVGTGKAGDFDAVYLYENNTRLTDGRSVSSSTNEVIFSGLNYTVDAGKTVALTVKGDLVGLGAMGHISAFQIASSADISSDASEVNGTFPITGNVMTVTSVEGGDLTIDNPIGAKTVRLGDTEVIIANFDVDNGTGEDIALQSVILTQNGSADLDDLANIVVEEDGESAGTITIKGDKLIITFEDQTIEDGDSNTYKVKADITALINPDDDAIEMDIEETYDIFAVGLTYGFGVAVNLDDYEAGTITVEGGKMNLSYVGPNTQDISAGNDVKVFTVKVVNADELKVRNISFEIESELSVADLEDYFDNFCLVNEDTGRTIDTTDTIGAEKEVTFTNDFVLSSGETIFSVLVDIDKDIYTEGDFEFAVNLLPFGGSDVKDLDTRDYLTPATDIVPSDGLTGKFQTVVAALVSAYKSSSPTDGTLYVAGSKDNKLAGFAFDVSTSEDIIINDLTLKAAASGVSDNITSTQDGAAAALKNAGALLTWSEDPTIAVADGEDVIADADLGTVVLTYSEGNEETWEDADYDGIDFIYDFTGGDTAPATGVSIPIITGTDSNSANQTVVVAWENTTNTLTITADWGIVIRNSIIVAVDDEANCPINADLDATANGMGLWNQAVTEDTVATMANVDAVNSTLARTGGTADWVTAFDIDATTPETNITVTDGATGITFDTDEQTATINIVNDESNDEAISAVVETTTGPITLELASEYGEGVAADPELIISSVYLEDTAGNVVASSENINATTDEVEFTSLDWELEASKTTNLFVMGDIRSDAADSIISFDLTYCKYKTEDTKKSGEPTQIPVAGQDLAIGQGVLVVKLDASTPIPTIAVAGVEDMSFSTYQFKAYFEDYNIEKITVDGWEPDETDNLETIYLKSSEDTVSTSSIYGESVTFTGLDWTVKKGKSLKITVSADIKDLEPDGLYQSGEAFNLSVGDDAPELNAFRAYGEGSGNVLREGDVMTTSATLVANDMAVYESKPYIELKSLSDTSLAIARKTLYKFTVTPDEVGDEVEMQEVRFITTGTATITLANAKLYKEGKTESIADGVLGEGEGAVISATGDTITFTGLTEEISASATYYIKADVGAVAADNTLSTRMIDDPDTDANNLDVSNNDPFVWADGTIDDIASDLLVIPDDSATLSN